MGTIKCHLYNLGMIKGYLFMLMSGFCFVDMGQIASGIGYDGADNYNKYASMDLLSFETATNSKTLLGSWNMRIQSWLKNYVYIKTLDPTKPRGAVQMLPTLLTFFASAIWHGFYVGFFMTFLGFAFFDQLQKMIEKFVGEKVQQSIAFKVFSWFYTIHAVSYFGIGFVYMNLDPSKLAYNGLGYSYGIVVIVGSLVMTQVVAMQKKREKAAAKKE